jgi:uncharacterized membrane protein YgcG
MHIPPFVRPNDSANQSRRLHLLVTVVVAFTLFGCSSSVELTSGWSAQEIRIDGDNAEWKDATTRLAGPNVLVGVKNDNKDLYLCLITSNVQTQAQLLALGTTVWFDTEGKKNKSFGIQFPVTGLLQGRRFNQRPNPEDLRHLIEAAQRQLEIVGPGTERHRFADRECRGVDVHLGYTDGTLTYELKVPLHSSADQPYAINADPTKLLAIGFETGNLADAMRGALNPTSPSSAPTGGGRGGGRSGGRGGTGGGGGSALGADAPEPLKHWLTVHLAGSSTPGQQ